MVGPVPTAPIRAASESNIKMYRDVNAFLRSFFDLVLAVNPSSLKNLLISSTKKQSMNL